MNGNTYGVFDVGLLFVLLLFLLLTPFSGMWGVDTLLANYKRGTNIIIVNICTMRYISSFYILEAQLV